DLQVVIASTDMSQVSRFSAHVNAARFIFPELAPNRYQLSFLGLPANCYLKSLRLGTQELPEISEFDFPGVQTSLEILVGADAGQITAAVVDEQQQPLWGVQVVAVPESRRRGEAMLYKIATSQQNGRAVLVGVRPGDYKLFA